MGHKRLLVPFICAACVWGIVSSRDIMDLTHKLDPKGVPQWPSSKTFTVSNDSPSGGDINIRSFCMGEHTGTHIDAPWHFYRAGQKLHQIPLEKLIVPGVVLDIRSRSLSDPRTLVTKDDLDAWESEHGQIPENSVVLMASGWSSRWNNARNYFGGDETNEKHFKFPGFSLEAAEILVNRKVAGVGVDTPSVDVGGSSDYPVHRLLSKHDIYILENLNKVEDLPAKGATIYAIPIYLKDGSGAPARVFAVTGENNDGNNDNSDNNHNSDADDDDEKTEAATNYTFRRLTNAGFIALAVLISLVPALLC